jgi:hypothetical protein
MKEIPLTQGQVAIVDDEDYPELAKYKWLAAWMPSSQAYRAETKRHGKNTLMHRLILMAPPGTEVDHKDHNPLNNSRSNLRICTRSENRRNSRAVRGSKSGYKGIVLHHGVWETRITVDGKRLYLGRFKDPESAAKAWDQAAIKYHGEFAYTNFEVQ